MRSGRGIIRGVDRQTAQIYEKRAAEWEQRRRPEDLRGALHFATRVPPGGTRVDLGCGPGFHLSSIGEPVVALDVAESMLHLARARSSAAPAVCADLEALPFARRALAGAWAEKSYVHLPRTRLPWALAQLHWALLPGAPLALRMRAGEEEGRLRSDDFPGRYFAEWDRRHLIDVVEGAGFEVDETRLEGRWIDVDAIRLRSLPDTVGPDLRMLVCGLNPSEFAADAGVGFARLGNRFWPAARRAGLVTGDRDPIAALREGVGMTDLVKRATPRADRIDRGEYAEGLARVERLSCWLRPGVVCFVGLAGWRAAVDPKATAGPIEGGFAGRAAYLMPSTSGANASADVGSLAAHLRAAVDQAGPTN